MRFINAHTCRSDDWHWSLLITIARRNARPNIIIIKDVFCDFPTDRVVFRWQIAPFIRWIKSPLLLASDARWLTYQNHSLGRRKSNGTTAYPTVVSTYILCVYVECAQSYSSYVVLDNIIIVVENIVVSFCR